MLNVDEDIEESCLHRGNQMVQVLSCPLRLLNLCCTFELWQCLHESSLKHGQRSRHGSSAALIIVGNALASFIRPTGQQPAEGLQRIPQPRGSKLLTGIRAWPRYTLEQFKPGVGLIGRRDRSILIGT